MARTPKWAEDLLLDACVYLGLDDIPDLSWRKTKHNYSSGRCQYYSTPRIVVSAGKNRFDQKLVLLHEIAHAANPKQHHSDKFWDTAWNLYRWAKLPIRKTLQNEGNYKKGAITAYKRSK